MFFFILPQLSQYLRFYFPVVYLAETEFKAWKWMLRSPHAEAVPTEAEQYLSTWEAQVQVWTGRFSHTFGRARISVYFMLSLPGEGRKVKGWWANSGPGKFGQWLLSWAAAQCHPWAFGRWAGSGSCCCIPVVLCSTPATLSEPVFFWAGLELFSLVKWQNSIHYKNKPSFSSRCNQLNRLCN